MAIKYLSGNRLWGTNAERLAMSSGVDKTGIEAYYQFEDATSGTLTNVATGSDYPDGTGTTNDSTSIGGGVTRVTGKVGSYAYEFDGSSTGIVAIGSGLISGTGAYTVAGWFWVDADAQGTALYLGATQEMVNYSYSTKKMSGGNTPALNCTTTMGLGAWHHFAVTRGEGGATVAKVYFDGEYEATGTNTTSINTTANFIGGISTVAEEWDGKIDELIIAGRAFTADEISAIWNGGTGGTLASMPSVKPELPNGSIFITSDTNVHYMWNGTDTWNEVA